ncbi:MAG: hypothetical protein IPK98_08790 [Chloracidobacterium sp.]|nr:hypothetical protein [Chloracidobacterium sp.]
MLKLILSVILPFLLLYNNSSTDIVTSADKQNGDNSTGTLQKMIVANGSVTMKVNIDRLNRGARAKGTGLSELRFAATEGAFSRSWFSTMSFAAPCQVRWISFPTTQRICQLN